MENSSGTNPVGLCSTCNNAATCAYRVARGFDALCCEMFDNYLPSTARKIAEDVSRLVSAGARETGMPLDTGVFTGLCVNCESRTTCVLASSEGRVWHCEEYA